MKIKKNHILNQAKTKPTFLIFDKKTYDWHRFFEVGNINAMFLECSLEPRHV